MISCVDGEQRHKFNSSHIFFVSSHIFYVFRPVWMYFDKGCIYECSFSDLVIVKIGAVNTVNEFLTASSTFIYRFVLHSE